MAGTEHVRDRIGNESTEDLIRRRTSEGWRMAAIEWEREVPKDKTPEERRSPVPYGLRVAGDCRSLETDPEETEILTLVVQMIVHERPLPAIAEALNQRGHRTRDGHLWSPVTVFNLMPRIIDASPGIFSEPAWPQRRLAVHT